MSKFMWLGIALVIAGITSGFLEQVFYGGRVDENNVVQDSFFLPLAFILMFLGVTLIVVAAGFYLMKKMRGPGN
jgi:multisubunit Na+/H+ antiporter MnhB subunit